MGVNKLTKNDNSTIWVQLTETGLQIYEKHLAEYKIPLPFHIENIFQFTFWDLLATFGPHIYHGLNCCFWNISFSPIEPQQRTLQGITLLI